MKISNVLIMITFLFSAHLACAHPIDTKEKADFLCSVVLNQKPYDYDQHFTPNFTKAIPKDDFNKLVSEIYEAIGKCINFEEILSPNNISNYRLISDTSRYATVAFSVNENNLIDSLQIKEVVFPDVIIDSWNTVVTYINSWRGHTSITVKNSSKNISFEKDSNELAPLGSGFKLYVLGTIADQVSRGALKWDQTFFVREDWKSLPGGVMQTWENGKQVSLKTFAEYMIKISDNTATDHLINLVGRHAVESQLSIMGNEFEKLNTPFLTTAEMFKIKWASPYETIQSYIHGDSKTRRFLLENQIAQIPLNQVGTNGISMESPAFIRQIEWFGSSNNLCEAMKSLQEKNSQEVFEILSKNVPFLNLEEDSNWSFAGYKGGSEPGVLTMTYLLKSKHSEWGCVSLTWHDEKKNLNQWVFFDLMSKLLIFTEKYFQ